MKHCLDCLLLLFKLVIKYRERKDYIVTNTCIQIGFPNHCLMIFFVQCYFYIQEYKCKLHVQS